MEVLAGARSDARQADLRRLLLRFHLHHFDAAADFDGAVRIYRGCRQAGITPRGLIDCMITAVAWRQQADILACDADLDRVARVAGIELDQAAPTGDRQLSGLPPPPTQRLLAAAIDTAGRAAWITPACTAGTAIARPAAAARVSSTTSFLSGWSGAHLGPPPGQRRRLHRLAARTTPCGYQHDGSYQALYSKTLSNFHSSARPRRTVTVRGAR
jgi:hypothetical protein